MATTNAQHGKVRFPVFQGILPIDGSQVPADIIAGITLAALAIPEVMGYTKIAGTPVITGLYTLLIPMTLYALFGSSRHLVVGADSATAAILASSIATMAAPGRPSGSPWRASSRSWRRVFLLLARLVRLGFLADFLSRTVLIGFLYRGRHPGRRRRDFRDAGPAGRRARHGLQASSPPCNRSRRRTYPR